MAEQARSLKVFVSYSRADVAFADQLVLVLEDKGFEPILDRHDISGAENWRDRLGKLILSADAVAFVLTAKSAASEICAWEVGEAQRLGKRIIPVTPESIEGVTPPAALSDLNWIPFHADAAIPGSGFYYGVKRLVEALSIDLDWLRAQTRYSERALEWARERPEDLLLRGEALKEAEAWQARTPAGAHPPDLVREYLAASGDAEQHRQVAAKAQLEEREQALKTAEAAVADSRRAQQALRRFSLWALVAGVILLAIAIPGNYFAATRTLDANDRKATLFADAANGLTRQGDYTRALLMALAGDPPARVGLLEGLMRPDGNVPVRNALARAYASDRAVASMDVEDASALVTLPDGRRFLTVHASGALMLWTAGEKLAPQTLSLPRGVENVYPLPDGDRIVIQWKQFAGQPFALWSLGQGKLLQAFGPELADDLAVWPQAVTLSLEGDWLAVGNRGKVTIWDTETGGEIKSTEFDPMGFDAIAASSENDAVTLSAGERVLVWEPLSGKRIGPIEGSFGSVRALAYYMDKDTLIFGAQSGNVGSVDPETGRMEFALQTFADDVTNPDTVVRLRSAKDSLGLLMMSEGGQVRLLDIASRKLAQPFGQRTDIVDGGFLPKAGMMVVLSRDGVVMLASYARSAEKLSLPSVFGVPDAIANPEHFETLVSNDGALALPGRDGSLGVWRPGMKAPITFTIPASVRNGMEETGFLFSPEASRMATSDGKKIEVWTPGSGAPATLEIAGADDDVTDGRFVAGGTAVFYRLGSGKAGVKAIGTGEDLFPARTYKTTAVYAGPDGRQIAEVADRMNVSVHVAGSDKPFTLKARESVEAVTFSPDGKIVALLEREGAFELWRPGEPRAFQFEAAHKGRLMALSFARAGDLFATIGEDLRIVLWRAGERDPVQAFEIPPDAATMDFDRLALQFSEDSGHIVLALPAGIYTFGISPIVHADVDTQIQLACTRLAERGVAGFSSQDYAEYGFLLKATLNPCVTPGVAQAAAKTP